MNAIGADNTLANLQMPWLRPAELLNDPPTSRSNIVGADDGAVRSMDEVGRSIREALTLNYKCFSSLISRFSRDSSQ